MVNLTTWPGAAGVDLLEAAGRYARVAVDHDHPHGPGCGARVQTTADVSVMSPGGDAGGERTAPAAGGGEHEQEGEREEGIGRRMRVQGFGLGAREHLSRAGSVAGAPHSVRADSASQHVARLPAHAGAASWGASRRAVSSVSSRPSLHVMRPSTAVARRRMPRASFERRRWASENA